MRKKITDKMRLDWLEKNLGSVELSFHADNTRYWTCEGKDGDTPRQAIDAAMAASKRGDRNG